MSHSRFLSFARWSVLASDGVHLQNLIIVQNTNIVALLDRILYMYIYSSSKKKKKKKPPYLFQYKLSYRNETGTNHHGLVSTLIWCFKIFLWGPSTCGGLNLTLIFWMKTPKFYNGIVKFTSQIAWKQIFSTFLSLVWEFNANI